MRQRGRGASLLSMLVIAAVVAIVFMLGAQIAPTVMEYQSVLKAVKKAGQESSPLEIRASFDRQAQIDFVKSVTSKDIDVQRVGDGFVASFAYNKEIHLVGPAYLTLKYEGKSK